MNFLQKMLNKIETTVNDTICDMEYGRTTTALRKLHEIKGYISTINILLKKIKIGGINNGIKKWKLYNRNHTK